MPERDLTGLTADELRQIIIELRTAAPIDRRAESATELRQLIQSLALNVQTVVSGQSGLQTQFSDLMKSLTDVTNRLIKVETTQEMFMKQIAQSNETASKQSVRTEESNWKWVATIFSLLAFLAAVAAYIKKP